MGGNQVSIASHRDAAEKRREFVARARLRGLTVRQIAEELAKHGFIGKQGKPVSKSQVDRDLKAIVEQWKQRQSESYENHVTVTLAKLDEIERSAWSRTMVLRDGSKVTVPDLEMVLKAVERRCKLLGLDKPARHEHSGPGGGPIPTAEFQVSEEESRQILLNMGLGHYLEGAAASAEASS